VATGRGFADDKEPKPAATGPNQDILGHASEEAADIGRVTGETQPDLGQGTPVQQVRLLPTMQRGFGATSSVIPDD
jgi:small subunit ribosomal protein S7